MNLCRFVFSIAETSEPIILDLRQVIYNNIGINYAVVSHLDDIWSMSMNGVTPYVQDDVPQQLIIAYGSNRYSMRLLPIATQIEIGRVMFTAVGRQLFTLANAEHPTAAGERAPYENATPLCARPRRGAKHAQANQTDGGDNSHSVPSLRCMNH